MTPIDHQQAAKSAAAEKIIAAVTAFVRDHKPISGGQVAKEALAAATPHLRAGIAEEVRDLRSQFHDDAKTAFGRIGSSTEAYLNALDDVLTLLEGGKLKGNGDNR